LISLPISLLLDEASGTTSVKRTKQTPESNITLGLWLYITGHMYTGTKHSTQQISVVKDTTSVECKTLDIGSLLISSQLEKTILVSVLLGLGSVHHH
jgi:hypothetical protein